MSVTKEQVVEFISNMTVLELSEFIKELEEKFGVSAAAPAAAMVMAAPADGSRRQQDRRHQGRARSDQPGPEGSQGKGRRLPLHPEGRREQGRSRRSQEAADRSRRCCRSEVSSVFPIFLKAGCKPRLFYCLPQSAGILRIPVCVFLMQPAFFH